MANTLKFKLFDSKFGHEGLLATVVINNVPSMCEVIAISNATQHKEGMWVAFRDGKPVFKVGSPRVVSEVFVHGR